MVETVKFNRLTPNSWSIFVADAPVALLLASEDGFQLLSPTLNQVVASREAAVTVLLDGKAAKISEIEAEEVKEQIGGEINGYPVKAYVRGTFSIIEDGERPIYSRGQKSRHHAGYWAVRFSGSWLPAFCPSVKTIEDHQSQGPWRTEVEMRASISLLNKVIKDRQGFENTKLLE